VAVAIAVSPAANKHLYALKRLGYVPGVRVTGGLRQVQGSFRGRVRVRGNKTARGKPNGNVVGRLNGKRVRYRTGK
jgi:hypothetical protein